MAAWVQVAGAGLAAALVVLALGPVAVPVLRRLRVGQRVRADGPQAHLVKQGTPTMGGLLFIAVAVVVTLAVVLSGPEVYAPEADPLVRLGLVLVGALGYGLLGLVDDYRKVVLRRPLGLRAREKLAGQALLAGAAVALALGRLGLSTAVTLPFGWGQLDLGPFYLPLAALLVMGLSNAVNLTDGLDGLAAGAALLAFLTYIIIAAAGGLPELAVFAAAAAGSLAGFLRFNYHPAQVFMGDTGSLALGGALGMLAVLTKTEVIAVLVGGLFIIETLSVVIQVVSFRATGRRVFRMSPLHHHFELLGWSELQVVHRFWLVAVVFAVLGLLGMMGGS